MMGPARHPAVGANGYGSKLSQPRPRDNPPNRPDPEIETMTQNAPVPAANPLAQALGRLPSGLYILTARLDDRATGMLASWVQQAGFEPPMLTVALRRDRFLADWIARTGRFTLSQVAAGQKHLIRHFARGFEPEADAFVGVAQHEDGPSGPILSEALAYLRCEVAGQVEGGDHRVVLARVADGGLLQQDAEPMLHVRKNGFHY